jgi:hypothetical protein
MMNRKVRQQQKMLFLLLGFEQNKKERRKAKGERESGQKNKERSMP